MDLKSVPPAMSKTSLPQRTVGINPREVDDMIIQQVKPPVKDQQPAKKKRRVDGVRSTLYNPIPQHFGKMEIVKSLQANFMQFTDMQINTIIPQQKDITFSNSKFGTVATGSCISCQQQQRMTNGPKIDKNIGGPDVPPPFVCPIIESDFNFVMTSQQLIFTEGLIVSQQQSNLYEEETREQSDKKKWHDLRKQRLSSSKFKDLCSRQKDFECLAARFLKKTIQTAAMKHGLKTEEDAAAAYADNSTVNIFPSGLVINPSCPHLAASPDRRAYDPTEESPWGLLEIKCPVKDSISELPYLKCVNGLFKLKKNSYFYQVQGQMLVTGAKWVDFFVYCCSDFHLERIAVDPDFLSRMKIKLDKFYFEHLLPKLMAV